MGAVCRSRNAAVRTARWPAVRAAGAGAARGTRLPRPDGQFRPDCNRGRQEISDGRGRLIRGHGWAGKSTLRISCSGTGDLVLLWLSTPDGDARGHATRVRKEI